MSKNAKSTAKTTETATPARAEVVAPVATPAAAATTAPAGGVQIVKKISNALMKSVPVGGRLRVAGQVKKAVGKESNFGPYTEFVGDFAARILGTLYKSHKLLLPAVADAELASQYAAALEQVAEGEGARIEFVFDLLKVEDKDPKNVNGFQWSMETLNAPAPESDKTLAMLQISEEKKPLALTS